MASTSAIEYQTDSIKKQTTQLNSQLVTNNEKSKYQMEMYYSVKFVNEILLVCYVILFSVIHLLLLVQYIIGVKRDEIADTIWLSVFFFYPYLIYYLESNIYFAFTYLLSLVYGKTYVYQFDKMLLFTDFYADPGSNK